ncbi:unnamed protein product [Echinostoma caproni]|uniref:ATPase n=1 Tax=Echinostoma caproni TaxID=27848 RepID=A0A183ABG9_9TREM|nr:unnamed protein product [Echinostoma caproni]
MNIVLTSRFASRYALLNDLIDAIQNDRRIVDYTRATVEPERVVLEFTNGVDHCLARALVDTTASNTVGNTLEDARLDTM